MREDAYDLRRPAGRTGGGHPSDAVRRDLLYREDATVHGAPARDRGGAYPRGREPASPRRDGTDASAGPHGTEYRRGATVPEPDAPPDDPSTGPRPGLEHGQGTPGHIRDGRRISDPGHRAERRAWPHPVRILQHPR